MPTRTRSAKFVRSLVEAATVRPMLSALLEMKRARVRDLQVAPPVAPTLTVVEPRKAA